MAFERDSSADVKDYDVSTVVYTDTTDVVAGTLVYDNTGTPTGQRTTALNSDGSWDLATHAEVDTDGFTYTLDNDTIIFESYTGESTDVKVPEIEWS